MSGDVAVDGLPGSWKEAQAAGSMHYFTGRPCKRGHIDIRLASTGVCRSCAREKGRERYAEDPARSRATHRKWLTPEVRQRQNAARRAKRAANPDAARAEKKKWESENVDKVSAARKKSYARLRLKPAEKLNAAMAAGIRHSLRKGAKGGHKWESLAGYSLADLMSHLQAKFEPGMSWENYGRDGWEIDHIIPRAAHNIETPDDFDFKRCWALSNLQPLWAPDNRRKNDRLVVPFQPSFAFGPPATDNDPPVSSVASE